MAQARHGDTVKVHYTGKLDDGSVFDTSQGDEPLSFKLGADQVIPGFEELVLGMSPGEKRSAKIACENAYGPHREELILEIEREKMPEGMDPEVGHVLEIGHPSGMKLQALIVSLTEELITLDANHPLAGKALTFEVELLEIT
jgi:FKBP-type peptidyl-prolyl cis-trans isomerase 2